MTIDDVIKNAKEKAEECRSLLNQEFISDYYCPGGFRKPLDVEIKGWKKCLEENECIVKWLEELKEYKECNK